MRSCGRPPPHASDWANTKAGSGCSSRRIAATKRAPVVVDLPGKAEVGPCQEHARVLAEATVAAVAEQEIRAAGALIYHLRRFRETASRVAVLAGSRTRRPCYRLPVSGGGVWPR